MTVSKSLLIGGLSVPYESAKLFVRQPNVKEICLLTEERFFTALEWLNFDKDNVLTESDKKSLGQVDNFQLLLMILNGKVQNINQVEDIKEAISSLFLLLFPDYNLVIQEGGFILFNNENPSEYSIISIECFNDFKDILNAIFPVLKEGEEENYRTTTKKGKELADKFKARKKKLAQMKANEKGDAANIKASLIQEMVSILSIGNHITVNEILDKYTFYQLFYQYKRLRTKIDYDTMVKLRLAGAEDVPDSEHWLSTLSL